MTARLAAVVLAAVPFVWLGMVLAISLLETPLKFWRPTSPCRPARHRTAGRPGTQHRRTRPRRRLTVAPGPVTAVSDWSGPCPTRPHCTCPAPGRPWHRRLRALRHPGALRRHLHVDAPSIVLRVLTELADRAEIGEAAPSKAIVLYRLNEIDAATPGSTEGSAE
jgi:hypothetical protein